MKLPYEAYGNDLYCKFSCTCLDPKWENLEVAHLFNTKIRLWGYNDANFFENVNKEPRNIECTCGEVYSVRWFYDSVEVTKQN